jgi:hypothetical protein
LEASLEEDSSFFITGDKRFLKGMIEHPELYKMALDKLQVDLYALNQY